MHEAYIVIDIGTGNVRVAVVSPGGAILGLDRADIVYHKDTGYPDGLYFDPKHLWQQIAQLTKTSLAQAGQVNILALTATSQREGIVLVDAAGNSVIGLPNIDHRGREWESMMDDKSAIYQLTGRFPSSLFSAMKLVGMRERKPDMWQQTVAFMSISDWAEYMLSGVLHYEHSQASETLLFDIAANNWSGTLCKIFNIDAALLPPLKASGTILGNISPAKAESLNISAGAKVIVGGGDTQLAVMGTNPDIDDVVIVSGTTTPIIKLTSNYVTDVQERTWTGRHTDGASFMFEANAGVTGLNYQRLKEIFYPSEGYDVIEKELAELTDFQVIASLGSLLADEKGPLTKGGFIFDAPVSHLLTRAGFVWATLWDMACSIAENCKTLHSVSPHEKDYVLACGGGMQSLTFRQFIAALTGKKVVMRGAYRQSSAIGGAFICNKALGKAAPVVETMETVAPEQKLQYASLFKKWQETRLSFKNLLC